jgi:hypothetical protein
MSTIKNILTFGAYGRIEKAMKKYNKVKKRYLYRLSKMKSKSRKVEALLKTVVRVKVEAVKNLNTYKEFSVGNMENPLATKFKSEDFKQINQILEKSQLALTAAAGATVGATAGVGTALAAWGLASTLGVASTGTAISTLSGAAATNATLALLGGGAVAAGGGGMVAGATVLGGIVAIPALIGLGVFSHFSAKKKIFEIESAIYKMKMNMYKMDANIIRLKAIQKKSNKLIGLINKKSHHLKYELNIANQMVTGELNQLTSYYHQIRTIIFGRSVTKLANEIALLIDTPIFNDDAEKVRLHKKSNIKMDLVYKMLASLLIVGTLYFVAFPIIKDYVTLNVFSQKTSVQYEDVADYLNQITEGNLDRLVNVSGASVEDAILVFGDPKVKTKIVPETDTVPYLIYDKFSFSYQLNEEQKEYIDRIEITNVEGTRYKNITTLFGEPHFYDYSGENMDGLEYFGYENHNLKATFYYDHFDKKKKILFIEIESQ